MMLAEKTRRRIAVFLYLLAVVLGPLAAAQSRSWWGVAAYAAGCLAGMLQLVSRDVDAFFVAIWRRIRRG